MLINNYSSANITTPTTPAAQSVQPTAPSEQQQINTATDTVTLSDAAKQALAAEQNNQPGSGSGNEPPIKPLGSGSGNEPPIKPLGSGSGNEPPINTLGSGSGNEPPIKTLR